LAKAESKVVAGRARPLANYPHVKRAGDWLFVSGTSARQADNSIVGAEAGAELDIRLQTGATIENLRAILQSVGADLDDLVDLTCFLVDMDDYGGFNEVYNRYFDADGPARTTVAVRQLPHPHLLVEIKATARRPAGAAGGDGG
jgi:2-aminomuconate deaminase